MFEGHGGFVDGWGYVPMMFGMLVFVGLLLGAVVALIRSERKRGVPAVTGTPEELLANRFARCEIDEGEYTGRLAVLRERVSS